MQGPSLPLFSTLSPYPNRRPHPTRCSEDRFLTGSPGPSELASKPDWRPSPEALKKRFPCPYENYHLGERISSGFAS